mgnify:CR=1 FL=1
MITPLEAYLGESRQGESQNVESARQNPNQGLQ